MKATLVLVVFSMMSGADPSPGTSAYERLRAYAEQSYDSLAACQQELPPLFRDAKLYYMNDPSDGAPGHAPVDMRPAAHLLAIDTNFRISVDCYEGGSRLERIDLAAITRPAPPADGDIVVSRCDAGSCGGGTPGVPGQRSLQR
jgi:hypothetical protein